MSQCVPSWDLDNNHNNNNRFSHRSRSNLTSPDVPMLDYHEVAELTWENGHIAMHSLAGSPRVPAKTAVAAAAATNSATKYAWEKPRASGTLESIVNQATSLPNCNPTLDGGCGGGSGGGGGNELAPWFHQQRAAAAAAAAATATVNMAVDALVPCSNRTSKDTPAHVIDTVMGRGIGGGGGGDGRTCVVDCSTLVGSCSGPPAATKEVNVIRKRARVARVTVAPECSGGGGDQSASGSGSATCERTHDTYNNDMADLVGVGFTSTSMGSPENTSSAKPCTKATTTADDHDSVSHCRPQREAGDEADKKKGTGKSSVSTKRSRAAAIHNQSERKRRDKINQRMKTLQKLVPNSSKTDKASMLDEVIEYLKQLQAQIQMMSRMNMPQMMLPMTMQQQLQMSMMAPMGMGMGMGMGVMDMMNAIARPNIPAVSPVITPPFMPMAASWDGSGGDRLQAPPATVLADPLSFLACQSQPMTMDAYSRMASLYQQLQQPPPASSSKS
ncbi:hypothetical protein Q3G72_029114 [Acer saccharum]|nr:hypothetical protein Q3G72_029114 [Acer saccharum]